MPETSLEDQYKEKLYTLYPNAQPGAIAQLIRVFKNMRVQNQIKMLEAQAARASQWLPPSAPPGAPLGFGVTKRTRNKIRHKRKTHRKSSKK